MRASKHLAFMQVGTIARFAVLEALRTRMPWLVLLMLLALLLGAAFLGELAITEADRVQVTVLAAMLRPVWAFILCLFIVSSVAREFQDKGVDLILSLDVTRTRYVAGKLLGFCLLGCLLALLAAPLPLLWAGAGNALMWGASLAMELAIVAALSLFCALTLHQVPAAAGFVAAFYLLARGIAAIQLISRSSLFPEDSLFHEAAVHAVDLLALLLPRLDRFTRSDWLVAPAPDWSQLGPLAVQTAIYLALLGFGALFDMQRKSL